MHDALNPPGAPLRDYALAELSAAIAGLRRRGKSMHEGIHRARKGIRRSRAMLALGTPALGPGVDLVERELKRINRSLSPMRDAQALVQTLDRLIARAPRDKQKLLKKMKRSARDRRAQLAASHGLAEELRGARATLKALHAALLGLEWDAITLATVADALAAAEERTGAAQARALGTRRDEDWHRWRRRLRTKIQQSRAAAIAGAGAGATLYDRSLAEQMGVMQDLSVLREHCNRHSGLPKAERTQLRDFARKLLVKQRRRIASVSHASGREPPLARCVAPSKRASPEIR